MRGTSRETFVTSSCGVALFRIAESLGNVKSGKAWRCHQRAKRATSQMGYLALPGFARLAEPASKQRTLGRLCILSLKAIQTAGSAGCKKAESLTPWVGRVMLRKETNPDVGVSIELCKSSCLVLIASIVFSKIPPDVGPSNVQDVRCQSNCNHFQNRIKEEWCQNLQRCSEMVSLAKQYKLSNCCTNVIRQQIYIMSSWALMKGQELLYWPMTDPISGLKVWKGIYDTTWSNVKYQV